MTIFNFNNLPRTDFWCQNIVCPNNSLGDFLPIQLYICLSRSTIDESPRWLVSQCREEEAIQILRKIAKVNKGTDFHFPKDIHFEEERKKREVQFSKLPEIILFGLFSLFLIISLYVLTFRSSKTCNKGEF